MKKTIIISFYCDKEGKHVFSDYAKLLQEDCNKLGLPNEIDEIEVNDTWSQINRIKPRFILDKLLEHQEPVCWIDCDSRIYAVPTAIYDISTDIAVVESQIGREDISYMASVLYFDYNPKVIAFLENWISCCEAKSYILGEHIPLLNCLERRYPNPYTGFNSETDEDFTRLTIKTKEEVNSVPTITVLPKEYCQIQKTNSTIIGFGLSTGIVNKYRNNIPPITVAITTCKRLSHFEQTITSFREKNQDNAAVYSWFIQDDGSSTEEIRAMKRLLPEAKIVTNSTKGHAKSVENLLNRIQTQYVFWLEDDWKFLLPGHYFGMCLDVMESDELIYQVGLRNFECSEIDYSLSGIPYRRHFWTGETNEVDRIDTHWPGFSLNPGLIKTDMIRKALPFAKFQFEFKAGEKLAEEGYVAHLTKNYVEHTGNISAYLLNSTKK